MPDLSPYRAIRKLGEGGFAAVFLARSPGGERVALKVYHQQDEGPASLPEHPNIARIVDRGKLDSGASFVAVELLEGLDLAQILAESDALEWPRAIELTKGICAGLSAAHRAGALHLDLKPSNIFIVRSEGGAEQVKLLDFSGGGQGTPEYWSPEQSCGGRLDARSDIYALGVVLYELLSGRFPFTSHSISDVVSQHVHADPAELSAASGLPPLPCPLEGAVLRCLRKEPNQRFASAEDLERTLDQISDEVAAPRRVRGPLLKGALIAAAVALACASAFLAARYAALSVISPGGAAVKEERVSVELTSSPPGAYVYRAEGGQTLARTPARINLPRRARPIELLFRFPGGESARVRLVPDRRTTIHARSPRAAGDQSPRARRGGARRGED